MPQMLSRRWASKALTRLKWCCLMLQSRARLVQARISMQTLGLTELPCTRTSLFKAKGTWIMRRCTTECASTAMSRDLCYGYCNIALPGLVRPLSIKARVRLCYQARVLTPHEHLSR
jgi:hypothetical protein